MASTINASNTGAGGLVYTADSSGVLNLQAGGVTALTVNGGSATLSGNLELSNTTVIKVGGDAGTTGSVLTSQGSGAAPTWSSGGGGVGSTLFLWSQLS